MKLTTVDVERIKALAEHAHDSYAAADRYWKGVQADVVAQLADAWLCLREWLAADERMAELCDTVMTDAVAEEMNEVGNRMTDVAKRARAALEPRHD